jgi:hypothetical protein
MEEAVMPAKFDVDDLEFSDEDFKAFVYSKLKELNEVSKGQI